MNDIDLARYADTEAIKRLKAQYCRYIDTKQWDRLAGLFAKGTMFEGFGSAPTGSDETVFVKGISTRMKDAVSIHHVHSPEIAFLSPDRARGIWAMMDLVELGPGVHLKEFPGGRGYCGYGHYEEEYVRTGDGWKFSFLRLTRLRLDPMAPDHPPIRHDLLAHSPDWLDG
jgi:hypothetical protein